MTERERQLESAYKHLSDIAALALAHLIGCETGCDDIFQRELAELYREQQGVLTDPSPHFSALRERLRGEVHYERARIRLREHMAEWFAGIKSKGQEAA